MNPICTYGRHAPFQVGIEDAVDNRPVVHGPPLRVLPVRVGRSPLEGRSAIAGRQQVVCAEVDAPGRKLPELGEKRAPVSHVRIVGLIRTEEAPDGAQRTSRHARLHTNRDRERRSRGPHVCGALASNHHPGDGDQGQQAPCRALRPDATIHAGLLAARPGLTGAPPRESYNERPVRARPESRAQTCNAGVPARAMRARACYPQPTRNNGHPTGIERGDMAKPAARGVERHLRDPAPVVADRR